MEWSLMFEMFGHASTVSLKHARCICVVPDSRSEDLAAQAAVHLHHLGLTPRLYSADNLHRGLVMEKGIGGWVELDTFERMLGTKANAVRKKLEKIVAPLQRQKMVHTDLRPKNIMVKVDENGDMMMVENEPILSVIDFDST